MEFVIILLFCYIDIYIYIFLFFLWGAVRHVGSYLLGQRWSPHPLHSLEDKILTTRPPGKSFPVLILKH